MAGAESGVPVVYMYRKIRKASIINVCHGSDLKFAHTTKNMILNAYS